MIVHDELESMWKLSWPIFKVSQHWPEGTDVNHENSQSG